MKYYKIIRNNEFIGVGTTLSLRRFQKKHGILLICDESEVQYIQCNEKLYRAFWMKPEMTQDVEYEIADVIRIERNEYDKLFAAIETNEEIVIEEPIAEEIPVVNTEPDVTVEFIRTSKIAEMKNICNKTITNGFDIELSDGESHHFSLTIQDQLNLITSAQMIADGCALIPYHADGELCEYYSVSDMQDIIDMSNSWKNYHISYFNSIKAYINSLDSMSDIADVCYGMEIPEAYQSKVLQTLAC